MIIKVSSVSFSENKLPSSADKKAKEALDTMRKAQQDWEILERLKKESTNIKEKAKKTIKPEDLKKN